MTFDTRDVLKYLSVCLGFVHSKVIKDTLQEVQSIV